MKELLEFLLEGIIGKKGFSVEERQEDGSVTLKIIAEKDLVGIIIGKDGQTIKAIQNILRVKGRLTEKYVFVSVEEKSD